MAEADIIDGVCTPIGRKKGSRAGVHPTDLGGRATVTIMERL